MIGLATAATAHAQDAEPEPRRVAADEWDPTQQEGADLDEPTQLTPIVVRNATGSASVLSRRNRVEEAGMGLVAGGAVLGALGGVLTAVGLTRVDPEDRGEFFPSHEELGRGVAKVFGIGLLAVGGGAFVTGAIMWPIGASGGVTSSSAAREPTVALAAGAGSLIIVGSF